MRVSAAVWGERAWPLKGWRGPVSIRCASPHKPVGPPWHDGTTLKAPPPGQKINQRWLCKHHARATRERAQDRKKVSSDRPRLTLGSCHREWGHTSLRRWSHNLHFGAVRPHCTSLVAAGPVLESTRINASPRAPAQGCSINQGRILLPCATTWRGLSVSFYSLVTVS